MLFFPEWKKSQKPVNKWEKKRGGGNTILLVLEMGEFEIKHKE